MAKNMKTRKGKDGFSYPYTSPDLVVDENGKSATTKFNEISSQFKDIANKTIVEDNKLYLVKPDGTKLDEGTDLPTSSGEKGDPGTSVTILSVVESTEDGGNNVVTFSDGTILNVKNGNKGAKEDGATGTSSIKTYNTESIGELFNQPDGALYLAWPAGNLRYDKNIDKYVLLINGADKHIFTTMVNYLYFIDPTTYEIVDKKELSFDDSKTEAICNLWILNDGSYMIFKRKNGVNDKNNRYISTNQGTTWTKTGEISVGYHFWSMHELSNGRLIMSCDVENRGFYYSDDQGVSWTNVKLGGSGGDYNAEFSFFEIEENKIIALGRKNMGGNGDPAIISYSTDNGTTWSDFVDSQSITDMNSSCCTGIVHDGIIEIFALSRWYDRTSMYTNTGKYGAITHYVATIENALNDNFTNNGIIMYSNGTGTGDVSQDFHCPCMATKDNDMLLVYFDRNGDGSVAHTNYYFIRGNLNQISYKPNDKIISNYFSYSSKQIEKMLSERDVTIATLQLALSKISGSGVNPPTGVEVFTYEHNFNDTQTLMGEDSPFYGNVYTTESKPQQSSSRFSYAIADSSVGESRKIFKQQKNQIVAYPTKNNFVIEVKLVILGKTGVGLSVYDNGKYYGICSMNSNKFTNGGTFESSYDSFSNKSHVIKLKKQNEKYSLVIDNIDYDCPAMTGMDGNSIIETKDTKTWTRYDEKTNALDTSTFSFDGSKIAIVLGSTSVWGDNLHEEIDYIKYGEWD